MRTTRSLISRAALGVTMVAGLAAVTAATNSSSDAAMFGGPVDLDRVAGESVR